MRMLSETRLWDLDSEEQRKWGHRADDRWSRVEKVFVAAPE